MAGRVGAVSAGRRHASRGHLSSAAPHAASCLCVRCGAVRRHRSRQQQLTGTAPAGVGSDVLLATSAEPVVVHAELVQSLPGSVQTARPYEADAAASRAPKLSLRQRVSFVAGGPPCRTHGSMPAPPSPTPPRGGSLHCVDRDAGAASSRAGAGAGEQGRRTTGERGGPRAPSYPHHRTKGPLAVACCSEETVASHAIVCAPWPGARGGDRPLALR